MNALRKLSFVFSILLPLVIFSFGCRGPQARSEAAVQQTTFFPYQTEIKRLDSGALFFWFIAQDRKTIVYEPCVGTYGVDLLNETTEELIFTVTESRGVPLDLLSGRQVPKSEVIGRKYRARIDGTRIVEVSEIKCGQATQFNLISPHGDATSARVLTSGSRPDAETIRLTVTLQNRGRTTLGWVHRPFSLFRGRVVSEDGLTGSSFGDDPLEFRGNPFAKIVFLQLKPGESFVWEHQLVLSEPLQTSTVLVTIVARIQINSLGMVDFLCGTLKLPDLTAK